MKLRLQEIANLIKPCQIVVDVGTDHAYLPIDLIQTKKAQICFGLDNKQQPLNSAITNVCKNNLCSSIGLFLYKNNPKFFHAILNDQPIDYLVIAGLGGPTIIDILKPFFEQKIKINYLILQPTKAEPKIRAFLKQNHWLINGEKVIFDNGIYYETIVSHQKEGVPIKTNQDVIYGPLLYANRSSTFINKWKSHLAFLKLHLKATKHPVPKSIYLKSYEQIKKDLEI